MSSLSGLPRDSPQLICVLHLTIDENQITLLLLPYNFLTRYAVCPPGVEPKGQLDLFAIGLNFREVLLIVPDVNQISQAVVNDCDTLSFTIFPFTDQVL